MHSNYIYCYAVSRACHCCCRFLLKSCGKHIFRVIEINNVWLDLTWLRSQCFLVLTLVTHPLTTAFESTLSSRLPVARRRNTRCNTETKQQTHCNTETNQQTRCNNETNQQTHCNTATNQQLLTSETEISHFIWCNTSLHKNYAAGFELCLPATQLQPANLRLEGDYSWSLVLDFRVTFPEESQQLQQSLDLTSQP